MNTIKKINLPGGRSLEIERVHYPEDFEFSVCTGRWGEWGPEQADDDMVPGYYYRKTCILLSTSQKGIVFRFNGKLRKHPL